MCMYFLHACVCTHAYMPMLTGIHQSHPSYRPIDLTIDLSICPSMNVSMHVRTCACTYACVYVSLCVHIQN